MKKTIAPRKIKLSLETVKSLSTTELAHVVGGATKPCTHPTTTVLPTGPC